jgi:hypothetical protein
MTLQVYCKPLRHLPVDQINAEDVLAVLNPIWSTVPETASRVRGRIERVIDAARARGLRTSENPCTLARSSCQPAPTPRTAKTRASRGDVLP